MRVCMPYDRAIEGLYFHGVSEEVMGVRLPPKKQKARGKRAFVVMPEFAG